MQKKKFLLLLTSLTLSIGLTSCKPQQPASSQPPLTYSLSISDVRLEKGQEHTIRYYLTPSVSDAQLVYEVIDESVDNMLVITSGVIYAYEEGVAHVQARAYNRSGASETWSAETTFKVSVTPVPDNYGDEIIKNGGFENGYDKWTLTPSDPTYVYKITVNSAKSHTGDAALNLWYNPDEKAEESVALDLIVGQYGLEVEAGTYLFSFWYIGELGEINAAVTSGEETLASETFPGYGYKGLVLHNGYVNYGLEVTLPAATNIDVELHFSAEAGAWGFLDDVSFERGTLDDLVVAPKDGEDGEYNFITNGHFDYNVNGWEITKPDGVSFERVSKDGGYLGAWNISEGDVLSAYYLVKDVPALNYNAAVYFNGGDGAFTSSKLVILDADKTLLHAAEFTTIGWNNGIYAKAVISDVALSGDVYVGVEIVGSNAAKWINFDNFALWSFGYVHDGSTDPDPDPDPEPIDGLEISLEEKDWTNDASGDGADELWFSDGISYGTTKMEGPYDALTLTSTVSDIPEGEYTLSVTYSVKHGNLSVNGVETTYEASDWTEYKDEILLFDVVVESDGKLELTVIMTPGTWSYVKISAITLLSGEVVVDPDPDPVTPISVSLLETDWSHDGEGSDTLDYLWFGSKLSYGSTNFNGPHPALTLTSTVRDLEAGSYTISVTYSAKHGNLSVNGVETTYEASDWTEYTDEILLVSDVVVSSEGVLVLNVVLTPNTYSYLKISAINLTLNK